MVLISRVYIAIHGFTGVYMGVLGIQGFTGVFMGVLGIQRFTGVFMGVHENTGVYRSIHGCT